MAAPPPPPTGAPVAALPQITDSSGVVPFPRRISTGSDVVNRPVRVERHVSVPCDNSSSSADVPLSHSLPRRTSLMSDVKVTLLSACDIKVTVLSACDIKVAVLSVCDVKVTVLSACDIKVTVF